jgi:anti-sigma regulatory factor (Ser/Thr protein kinase)
VLASPLAVAVRIADRGGGRPIPEQPAAPDLDAKLAGLQTPRGWGLYLIKNLVDEVHIGGDATQHTIELILYRQGPGHGCNTL